MALKAIAFRIVVKPNVVETKTASGIVLAINEDVENGAVVRGIVVDIGEDAWAAYKPKTEFAGLKVGDQVYFARYAGKRIKETDDGEEFLVLNDEDIVCKVMEEVTL